MILESRFLEKPAFAVEQGRNAARHMESESRKALDIALGLIQKYDEEQAGRVENIEAKVDRYEDELGTYLVKLNNKDLSEKDSHSVLSCFTVLEILNVFLIMQSTSWSQQENFMKKISAFLCRQKQNCRF